MKELTQILEQATAGLPSDYFHLAIAGGLPIQRERVYCYELYHQMRQRWPERSPYRLGGEIDKAAHPIISKLSPDDSKPDLLVHKPGEMDFNHAVIEVKTSSARSDGITKDLETLSFFVQEIGYERAIYLFFGDIRAELLIAKIRKCSDRIPRLATIEVWMHSEQGHAAFCATKLNSQ